MTTLEEAMATGQGTERPCQCPVHEDHHDSASVNVVKSLWYCHACHASGSIDDKKPPSTAALMAMLADPRQLRAYPESYLDFFGHTGAYWLTRFSPAVCFAASLGEDPFTGHPTYPVRTPLGALGGLVHRQEEQPKYKYPAGWSASRTLGWSPLSADVLDDRANMVVLTEGFPDALALAEVGVPAVACYGAGLHLPQRELLLRSGYRQPVLGFDADDAGKAAAERSQGLLADMGVNVPVVEWPAKDPGEMTPDARIETLVSVVGERYVQFWSSNAAHLIEDYERYLEENHG